MQRSTVTNKELPELMKGLDLAIVWTLKVNNHFSEAAALHDEIRSLISDKTEIA